MSTEQVPVIPPPPGSPEETRKPYKLAELIPSILIILFAVFCAYKFVSPLFPASHPLLTKQEWMQTVSSRLNQTAISFGKINCPEDKFYREMGQPESFQSVGEDETYLYYRCKDGMIQIVCSKYYLEKGNLVLASQVNDYLTFGNK